MAEIRIQTAESAYASEDSSATLDPFITPVLCVRFAFRDGHYRSGRTAAAAYRYPWPGQRDRCVGVFRSGGG